MRWDAVTLEILWHRLVAIADEMAAYLVRTAFSAVVRESNDFACALLTPEGELVAEYSRSIPSFVGTMPVTCRHFLERFGCNNIQPGDVLATNDPWVGTGHLPDLTVITPVFSGDRLVAFCGSVAHLADIGGSSEGAWGRDIYEEGICLPAMKLYEAGRPNRQILDLFTRNVRVPEMVLGDVEALVAANRLGAERLGAFLAEYGQADISDLARTIADLSEAAMLRAVRAIPPGEYRHRIHLDGFGAGERVQVSVQVKPEGIFVDYSGTSPQSRFGINSVMQYTRAYTTYPLKCLLSPELPNNAGTYRPITVHAPEGTLLNPVHPAPVGARFLTAHFLQAAIFGALAGALPDRVTADSGAPFWVVSLKGARDGRPFAAILSFNGGQGARLGQKGHPCLSTPSNVANAPIEVVESEVPVQFEKKAIARRTGGRGRWRGGDGQEVVIRSVHDGPMDVILLTDRLHHPALGCAGGGCGATGRLKLDGRAVREPKGRLVMAPGSRLYLRTPGGGGYGANENV